MKDSTRRALRTLLHGLVAAAVVIPTMAAQLPTPTGRIGEIVGVLLGGCALVTKVVNVLEDKGWLPAFLKAPPSPGANPVPDPAPGETEPEADTAPPTTVSPAGGDSPYDPAP